MHEKHNTSLTAELKRERARVDKLTKDVNSLEQYIRQNNIKVFGIDYRRGDETPTQTEEKIIALLKNSLGVSVKPSEIEACHRLGRFSLQTNRPIIVRFCNRKLKSNVITNRYKLQGKSQVICEDLTYYNFNKLRDPSNVFKMHG